MSLFDVEGILLLWQLLLQAEDDGDAKAASQAKAEQMAEMAEFDENFSMQGKETKVVVSGHFPLLVSFCNRS